MWCHNQTNGVWSVLSATHIYRFHVLVESHLIIASKSISKLAQSQCWRASLPSLDHSLDVYIQTRVIISTKCISSITQSQHWSLSQFTRSWPSSVYSKLRNYTVQVGTIIASKCISNVAWLCPQSESLSSHDHGHQAHLQPRLMMDSKFAQSLPLMCISKLGQVQPPKLFNPRLQTCAVPASKCFFGLTQLSSSCISQIALTHHLQPVQIYCGFLGSYSNT